MKAMQNPFKFVNQDFCNQRVAVAQGVEMVVHLSQGWWFDPQLLAMCWSVLEQDTEPQIASDGQASAYHGCCVCVCVGVCMCVKG